MKLFLFALVLAVQNLFSLSSANFLQFVGNYKYNTTNENRFTVKNYYISQLNFGYTCIQAILFCQASKMSLASISDINEVENFRNIANYNPSLFKDEIFVSSSPDTEFLCKTYSKVFKRNFEFNDLSSYDQRSKFLCESVEIVENFEPIKIEEIVDVESTFFQALNTDDYKSYFLSRISLPPPQAALACKSFGMNLTSPKSQDEYEKLQKLLSSLDEPTSAAISIFRSANNKKIWIDGNGDEVNFAINWYNDTTWKQSSDKNCAVFLPLDNSPMGDVQCMTRFQFICETQGFDLDFTANFNNYHKPENFLSSLYYTTVLVGDRYIDFKFGKSSIKLSFFDAKLLCQSLQMDLFTPVLDENTIFKIIDVKPKANMQLITGLTSMGSPDSWYSVIDGKILNGDRWTIPLGSKNCLVLECITAGGQRTFFFTDVDCTAEFNFICMKPSNREYVRYNNEFDEQDDDYYDSESIEDIDNNYTDIDFVPMS